MTKNNEAQTAVEFYPIEEMLKTVSIESRATPDVTFDVSAPVVASLDVGRHVYITLFKSALEQGRIKLAALPEAGIFGALRLLGELIEENRHLRSTYGQVNDIIRELVEHGDTSVFLHEQLEGSVIDMESRIDDVRKQLNELYGSTCEIADSVDELEGLLDVGDGA